jgi:methionyl-tRNA synthetase
MTGVMDTVGAELKTWAATGEMEREIAEAYEARDFCRVMVAVRTIADQANRYFDNQAPWSLVKTDPAAARAVLTSTLNIFRVLAVYLKPILPAYAVQVENLFGEGAYTWETLNTTFEQKQVGTYTYLATRIEKEQVDKMIEASLPAAAPQAVSTPTPASAAKPVASPAVAAPVAAKPAMPVEGAPKAMIDYDTFSKIDLRVGRVVTAELVEGADKLLKLMVDIGEAQPRQVFAGIRKSYDPSTLVGRLVVVVANLAPRKMRFGVSEGMVLAATNDDGAIFVVAPDAGAKAGVVVK